MAKILIVDDNALNRKLLAALLHHDGHETLEAVDGKDALEAVRKGKPQLVMSDILMPTMDGYEFVRQLRADAEFSETPVIFRTAHYHEREAQRLAQVCGVARVLAKPSESAEILLAVEQALAGIHPSGAQPLAAEFDRQHLQLVTDKLSQNATELRAANARFAALIELNVQLASERDPRLLLERVCQAARDLLGAKYAVLAVAPATDGEAVLFATSGLDLGGESAQPPSIKAGSLGEVFAQRRPLRVFNKHAPRTDIGLPDCYPPARAFLVAPLCSLTRTYGWLCLADKLGAEGFSAEDERVIATLGAQVGRIYENGSLYREVEQHAAQLLVEMEKRESAAAELRESETRFRQLAENIQDVFFVISADYSQTFYLSPAYERIWGRPRRGAYEYSMAWVDSIHPDDQARIHAETRGRSGGAPPNNTFEFRIVRPDGSIRWIQTRTFLIPAAGGTAQRLVGVATDITERKAAEARIQHLNRVYAMLSGINSLIMRVQDRAQLLDEACRLAVENGQFGFAWCGWLDSGGAKLQRAAWAGNSDHLAQRLTDSIGETSSAPSLISASIASQQPRICNDINSDVLLESCRHDLLAHGYQAIVALPLVGTGAPVGCLVLATAERGIFDAEEMNLLRELAGDISFALDHIEKAEQLNYLAYYDVLTGLANRTFFHERVSIHVNTAARGERRLALVVVQVERFDSITDSLGRHAADHLLRELAERFARCVGDPAAVARIGPDQFAAFIPDIERESDVVQTIERWWPQWLNTPFQVEGNELRLSANAGVALYPGDGNDADTLLKHAEAALKRAKTTGDRHLFYTRHLTEPGSEKLALESKLRRALENEEFVLHYQPKVDLETRRVKGVEALIRWNDPATGLVPPAQFIPLMEETGLIADVGTWVLQQACQDRSRWLERGFNAPRVAINVSTLQLRRSDFVRTVKNILRVAGSEAGIDIEVTESLIMQDVEDNIAKLVAIRDLGVRIAIDDFGTGYSSLGYLAKLPVETLKIDRSFIISMLDDPSAMTLVSTIISLAHALRLEVVAEGVESEEQAKILRLVRCDQMQGYLINKPMSFDDMSAYLARNRP
ncbi:MAG: response regulator receiver modulated sensor-containing diguanylate [Gammaproteobacteria bacterium]|nr:response regulator receiver modulated sensor-containing diguanylate [Gammaproteobacteria bacterium]